MRPLLTLLCVSLLACSVVRAQPASRPNPFTLAASLGPTANGGVHVAGSASGQRGHVVGTVRLSSNGLGRTVADGFLGSVEDSAKELTGILGYARPISDRWQIAGAAGLSAVWMHRYEAGPCFDAFLFCVPGDAIPETLPVRLGLPVEVSLYGPVSGGFGMGVRAFATVNAEATYGGAALELRLSPTRPRR